MSLPLAGRTVLVTRPVHQAATLVAAIRAAGGDAYEFPALAIKPVTDPQPHLPADTDSVIFISPNAAQFGFALLQGLPASTRILAVGSGTARVLAAAGVTEVIVPGGQDSEALLALPQLTAVAGQRIVIVRGVGGRPLLGDTLAARGATVSYRECYRRIRPDTDAAPLRARWLAGRIDAVTVASAETLTNLIAMLGPDAMHWLAATPLFTPHEKIAATARSLGITHATALSGGDALLVAGLIDWFRNAT